MTIIINNGNAARLSFNIKASANPLKIGKAAGNHINRQTHFQSNSNCRQTILHIMQTQHWQPDIFYASLCMRQTLRDLRGEYHAGLVMADINRPHIRIGRHPIGNDPPVRNARQQPLYSRMVNAQGGKAIKGNRGHKIGEGPFQIIIGAMVIQMFRIDVGDNRHCGFQA